MWIILSSFVCLFVYLFDGFLHFNPIRKIKTNSKHTCMAIHHTFMHLNYAHTMLMHKRRSLRSNRRYTTPACRVRFFLIYLMHYRKHEHKRTHLQWTHLTEKWMFWCFQFFPTVFVHTHFRACFEMFQIVNLYQLSNHTFIVGILWCIWCLV